MLIVPGNFVGHSVICDKCGVTFIAMPQVQYSAPPQPYQQPMPPQVPLQMPPAQPPVPYSAAPPHPMSMPPAPPPPASYGYGAAGYSMPTSYSPGQRGPSGHPGAPSERTSQSLPSVPSYEPTPLPQRGGEHRGASHPFGNPLPEIEILPPPKARRQPSRKRSGERSGEGKRRRRSSGEHSRSSMAPPPLPAAAAPPAPVEGRVSHTALARADHGSSGEVSEIELRIRRAQLRRTMSLAFACVGLLAMSVMGLLMIKYVKPDTAPPPEVAPVQTPTETPQPESAPANETPAV